MVWHRIVVGIGNPGPEHENTRHNVGFMVLDRLAEQLGVQFTRLERRDDDGSKRFSGKVKAQVAEGRRKGRSFLLVKPSTSPVRSRLRCSGTRDARRTRSLSSSTT